MQLLYCCGAVYKYSRKHGLATSSPACYI